MNDGGIVHEEVPALTAINMRLRDDYSQDAAGGVGRWNEIIEKAGVEFEMKLPHEGFHRKIGVVCGCACLAGRQCSRTRNGRRSATSGCPAPPTASSSSR